MDRTGGSSPLAVLNTVTSRMVESNLALSSPRGTQMAMFRSNLALPANGRSAAPHHGGSTLLVVGDVAQLLLVVADQDLASQLVVGRDGIAVWVR